MEKYGSKAEFLSMSKSTIADRLRIFYCEAAPKKVEVRGKTQAPLQEYHKNSLRNIRAALNRHFHDLYLDLEYLNAKSETPFTSVFLSHCKNRERMKYSCFLINTRPNTASQG